MISSTHPSTHPSILRSNNPAPPLPSHAASASPPTTPSSKLPSPPSIPSAPAPPPEPASPVPIIDATSAKSLEILLLLLAAELPATEPIGAGLVPITRLAGDVVEERGRLVVAGGGGDDDALLAGSAGPVQQGGGILGRAVEGWRFTRSGDWRAGRDGLFDEILLVKFGVGGLEIVIGSGHFDLFRLMILLWSTATVTSTAAAATMTGCVSTGTGLS